MFHLRGNILSHVSSSDRSVRFRHATVPSRHQSMWVGTPSPLEDPICSTEGRRLCNTCNKLPNNQRLMEVVETTIRYGSVWHVSCHYICHTYGGSWLYRTRSRTLKFASNFSLTAEVSNTGKSSTAVISSCWHCKQWFYIPLFYNRNMQEPQFDHR